MKWILYTKSALARTKSGLARPVCYCSPCKCMAKCGGVCTPGKPSLTDHSNSTNMSCFVWVSQWGAEMVYRHLCVDCVDAEMQKNARKITKKIPHKTRIAFSSPPKQTCIIFSSQERKSYPIKKTKKKKWCVYWDKDQSDPTGDSCVRNDDRSVEALVPSFTHGDEQFTAR